MVRTGWMALALAGCGFSVDYAGTSYRCPDGECPVGQECVAERCLAVDRADAAPSDADPAADAMPANLVINPDFESGIANWDVNYATLGITQSVPHGGVQSAVMRAELTDGGVLAGRAFSAFTTIDSGGISAGTRYLASAWVRLRVGDADPPTVSLVLREKGGVTAYRDVFGDSVVLPLNGTWVGLHLDAVVEGTDRTHVNLEIWAEGGTGGVVFDDVYAGRP